ncbi:MAG: protein-glutamate O-methyltransferase CheR [Actinobacteria bacterium]|nr:MAG: protein-glutamate O-methyltransferase CheR [Actinomycetota bacterium]
MRPATFEALRDIVYASSGIVLTPRKEALLCARVGRRMRALGVRDYDAYLDRVDGDPTEVVNLIDTVSTNVTSFFRESRHFEVVADQAAAWYAAGQRRFRFWSAACSTGEEPYSLAIALAERLPHDADVRILATDISTRVLAAAADAAYTSERTDVIDPDVRRRWFDRTSTGAGVVWRPKARIRETVLFRRVNLAAPPYPLRGPLDAVFCRNVMIYFDAEVRSGILAEAERLLRPGGLLVLGHAESLTRAHHAFRHFRPSVYRRS